MICSICNTETNGIKINGSLFCSNCGEKIEGPTAPALQETKPETEAKRSTPVRVPINVSDESEIPTPVEKESASEWEPKEPVAKDILESEATTEDIETLKAELLAIEMIEEEAKQEEKEARAFDKDKSTSDRKRSKEEVEIKNKEIKKHNRERVSHHHEEVKPIEVVKDKEPKSDAEITDEKPEAKEEPKEKKPTMPETDLKYPLLEKEKAKEIKEKAKKKQEILSKFLKQGTSQATKIKKKRHTKKIAIIAASLITPIVIMLSVVLYANLVGTKADLAVKKAEQKASFLHKTPGYVPTGYKPSFQTNGSSNSIEYVYVFGEEKDRTLKIFIEQNTKTEENIFEDYKKNGVEYLELTTESGKMLLVDQKVIVKKNETLLIEITSSEDIGTEEMIKIAEGLI